MLLGFSMCSELINELQKHIMISIHIPRYPPTSSVRITTGRKYTFVYITMKDPHKIMFMPGLSKTVQ